MKYICYLYCDYNELFILYENHMMTTIFHIMYSVYKRSGESDSEAYYLSVLCVAMVRVAIFFPLVCFCVALINSELNKIVGLLYLVICWFYSYLKAPRKESCTLIKKYDNVSKPLAYALIFLIMILGVIGIVLVGKYVVEPYGLEGWLLRFFK